MAMQREYRNWNKRHSCPIVRGKRKRCYRCGKWKPLERFAPCIGLSGGRAKLCHTCYNSHDSVKACERARCVRLKTAARDVDYKYYIKRRMGRRRNNAIKDGAIWTVTTEYLTTLWEKQRGRCYYSGIPMLGRGSSSGRPVWNSPSLDRKSPAHGYVPDNVVWCINAVNSFKGELTEKAFKEVLAECRWIP